MYDVFRYPRRVGNPEIERPNGVREHAARPDQKQGTTPMPKAIDNPTPSRRLALRYGGLAALAGLITPAIASAAPSGDDIELIAACAQFDALERQLQALSEDEYAAAHEAIQAVQFPLLERICAATCTTMEGLRARVRTIALWEGDMPTFAPDEAYWNSRMFHALLRDLSGEMRA